ncbi:MAG TPA: CARDB domain-containing protein, partial [Pyrinomonadaceae bacterium]|nr:CARDB domain-containing protein [Pyrinomonadaceae bacterium]
MVDLTARSLTITPEFPEPRERSQIRLEVQNKGAAASSVEIAFFVKGRLLTTLNINMGEQSIQTATVPWTPSASGLYTLSAVVDPRYVLTEQDRVDNAATLDVVVASRPPRAAEFAVSDVEVLSAPERPTMLQVTIRNDGSSRASVPLVLRQGEARRVMLVGPVERDKPVRVEIPWGADTKSPINAEINPRFKTAERQPNDNVFLRGARASIDLRVEDLALHTLTFQEGQRRDVTVTFNIVNAGLQPIARSFRSSIEPGTIDPDGNRPFFVTTSRLVGGGVAHVSHTIRNAPAQFTVTVVIDVDQVIAEADESNNTGTINFKNPAPDTDRWVSIGPQRITGISSHGYAWNDATGRLSAIAIDPTSPRTMYVGAQGAGVWKTTNGGQDWQAVADGATVRIAALALDPSKPSRVFLVTPREGVYLSEDSGTSWIQISSADLDAVIHGNVLLINPANSNDMVLASERGVYRSTDGGVTWNLRLSGGRATGLIRRPTNSAILYAAIFHETNNEIAGIYQSFDAGETWVAKQGCPGGSLPVNDAKAMIRLAVSGGQLFASY